MHKADFMPKIQIELVKLLYQQVKFGLWAETLAAFFLVAALWNAEEHFLLLSWLAFILSGELLRHLLVFYYYHSENLDTHNKEVNFWLTLFMGGVFLSGVSWGVAGSLFMIKHDIVRQAFVLFLLLGVTSAANSLYSPIRRVYAVFLLPAFLPFTAWLFLQGGIFTLLGLLAFAYIFIMLAIAFYSHKLICTSLALRFEKNDLVVDLYNAKAALLKRSHELGKTLALVRATLEATTDGILVVNSENKIEDFNQKFIDMWKIPFTLLQGQSTKILMDYIHDKLIDPASFIVQFQNLSESHEAETFDEILFKDGSVFERYSHPQYVGHQCVGRVWSFRDVTGRKFLEAKLFHQANFDSLTGLPNRVLVIDRLAQAVAYARRMKLNVAVLFLDLDRFKLLNDTLGHALGDKLLQIVADRLLQCVRENDTVSRAGGDEFLIILTSLKDETDAMLVARKCLQTLEEPFYIEGSRFNISSSIGISFYPRDGHEPETLIRNSDIAMYRAKESGRSNFQFFTEEMNKRVQMRLLLENQLYDALDKNEFYLVYQPIVNLKSKRITGVEALLRWRHDSLGLIPPAEFIPIAEESGVIIQLGEWVMRTACKAAVKWQREGMTHLQISVNFSARQFKEANFFEKIHGILIETELNPHYFIIELTESIIMEEVQKNITVLKKMKEAGIVIVIDDFGIGYSSLNYLKRLPVDKLKIDRSFIHDLAIHKEDAAITAAIIALANRLNLKVIAEGVENEAQLRFLVDHHCDEMQGFYFSKPLQAEDMMGLLLENKRLHSGEETVG